MSTIKNTVYRGMDGKVQQTTFDMPSELGPHEVLVKITHSGLCGTDIHGIAHGIALGHEGVGIVTAVGSSVTSYKVGNRAGGGFLRKSCGNCKYCATVYSALIDNLEPRDRVGIVGMGGLGHLAVQFANKLSAETVVFLTSRNKEAEARGFGVSEFVLLSLNTPTSLTRRARIIPLNAPLSTIELLHYGIKPVIKTFDISEVGIAQALEKMENGTIRYRGVLVNAEKLLP
ncbi:hypothetical protein V501_00706 [Pseudogymnoascus sp. VKM F-4519 (FW-2642)]|nr:hypothetical protein V501_00706 [Pseudogymnoascus sp. VKM F-4519 (FW-2642)]